MRALLLVALVLAVPLAGCLGGEPGDAAPSATEGGGATLAAATTTAWRQLGGPEHASVASGLTGPLDVLANGTMAAGSEQLEAENSLSAVPTLHGLSTVVYNASSGRCHMVTLHTRTLERNLVGPELACAAPNDFPVGVTAHAYDPRTDTLLACTPSRGASPVLWGLDAATGEPRWGISPEELGLQEAPIQDQVPRGPFGLGDVPWHCPALSMDETEGFGIVPLTARGGRSHVLAFELGDGEPRWMRAIGEGSASGGALPVAGGQAPVSPDGFMPYGIALTETGIVVIGWPGAVNSHSTWVWMDRNGAIMGSRTTPTGSTITDMQDYPACSFAPQAYTLGVAGSGPLAAGTQATDLVIVDPRSANPTVHPLVPERTAGLERRAAPAWWGDHLVVGLWDVLADYDSDTGEIRWTLPNPSGWGIGSLVIVPPNDLYAVAAKATTGERALFRVDLLSGVLEQQLPLPGTPPGGRSTGCGSDAELWDARVLVLQDGHLVVAARDGELLLLGPAPETRRPGLAVPDAYPAPGQALMVQPRAPDGVDAPLVVSWGDGAITEVSPGDAPTHSYADPGTYTIRATAVYPDNTTATSQATVHVGGTPPRDLNAIQTAFAKENQDLTFGVLGIAVAVAGGLIAVGRRRRSRGILQRELDAVDRAVALAGEEPAQQEAVLQERRAHAKGLLVDGRLEDAQYVVLERHIDEHAQGLRVGLIEEELAFLPVGMARALQSMLSDGRISAW
ncbi:MAG: PKD domain-containing protein, partial [Candidatus Thermoplasmatota archaeon]|nr:PKD domain-containing protein [Candidatus Thermoplasmatota archaeon]